VTALEPLTPRQEWLAWRRTGIGASDVAAILGLSPWASPWSVWAEKIGALPPEDDLSDDDPREFGRRAEAMVGPWFSDKTGLHIAGQQLWLTHKTERWALATPDGVVVGSDDSWIGDALGGLEIKTDFGKPWDEIPAHYQSQGQWQMYVADWPKVWFAVLHGRRFRIYELDRDQADIDFMAGRCRDFWHDYVLTATPPPIDGSEATERALKALYPEGSGEAVELADAGRFRLAQLSDAKFERKQAVALEKDASNHLRAMLGSAIEGRVDGRKACTLATQTRKTTCEHCGAVEESDPFRVLRPSKEFQ
jgi:putative phage-type endonuclease